MKILMVSVIVHSPVEAFKFYTEKLGFREVLYMPEAYIAIVASPEEPNGTTILLEPNEHPVAKTFQQDIYKIKMPVITFGVEDIQQEYEKLQAKGIEFLKPPTPTQGGIEAVFDDTCGNYIQVFQKV